MRGDRGIIGSMQDGEIVGVLEQLRDRLESLEGRVGTLEQRFSSEMLSRAVLSLADVTREVRDLVTTKLVDHDR